MTTCDYLVVGAGASGMIFADEMLTQSDARIAIVDRQHRPGGHWNVAYPFVTLHQPSAFYGAGSSRLGQDRIQSFGLNAGLYEQASGQEISAYFDRLMRERFLPSRRVQFFPMHDFIGESDGVARLRSRVSGRITEMQVAKRIVDTGFYQVSTPATHARKFGVENATIVTPNDLPRVAPDHAGFVIVGGGKTSMDVIIWLLQLGVEPDSIAWIIPRDSWLLNRECVQPGPEFRRRMLQSQVCRLEAAAEAVDLEDMFDRLEAGQDLLRVDPRIRPTMHYGATVSSGELGLLRQVSNVVRLGRVEQVDGVNVQLQRGRWIAPERWLFVDCSARGLCYADTRPVFEGRRITLQMVRRSLVSLSAAAIAFVEANYDNDASRNNLCAPVPYGDSLSAWPAVMLADLTAQERWAKEKPIRGWLRDHRLMGIRDASSQKEVSADEQALASRIAMLRSQAIVNLVKLGSREVSIAA